MSKKFDKPNIVLICSDQHNPKILGCYKDNAVDSPSIDRLANDGILFESAYCNSPLCVPSRMSFLTGLYPYECECLGNGSTLASIIPTYAHLLGAGGYHTVLSGRMHFKGPDQRHGFMERLVGDVASYTFWKGGIDYSPLKGELGNMSTPDPLMVVGAGNTCAIDYDKAVTGETCKWLRWYTQQPKKIPFLLTVGFHNPHCPYIAPPELFEKYKEKVSFSEPTPEELVKLHPYHKKYRETIKISEVPLENQRKARIAYYGLVEFLDTQMGMILDTLGDVGLLDNTIVVYFSDHGEMLGAHGLWHKGCFFEESVRVPLVIRLPDKKKAGGRVSEVVSLLDLLPTVCEWGNAGILGSVSGRSLVPLIDGESAGWENIAKSEYYAACNRMVRKDRWKLCFYSNYEECELYDLENDPDECHNLADDPSCSERLKELKGLVFSDGWNTDLLKKREEKLSRYGYWDLISGFGNAVNNNPLLRNLPDSWPDSRKSKNYVV